MMTYARIENGQIVEYPVYEGEIRNRFRDPLVIFGQGEYFAPPDGYARVSDTAPPPFDPAIQDLSEAAPELVNGEWHRAWAVTDAPPEVIAARLSAKRAGMEVTMRQARLALLGAGKLAEVDAALASLPSPLKEAAQIEWEYAATVRRDSPLIAQLGPALGMTDDAIDALFEVASTF